MSKPGEEFHLTKRLETNDETTPQKLFFPIEVGALILNVDIENQISILTEDTVQNEIN